MSCVLNYESTIEDLLVDGVIEKKGKDYFVVDPKDENIIKLASKELGKDVEKYTDAFFSDPIKLDGKKLVIDKELISTEKQISAEATARFSKLSSKIPEKGKIGVTYTAIRSMLKSHKGRIKLEDIKFNRYDDKLEKSEIVSFKDLDEDTQSQLRDLRDSIADLREHKYLFYSPVAEYAYSAIENYKVSRVVARKYSTKEKLDELVKEELDEQYSDTNDILNDYLKNDYQIRWENNYANINGYASGRSIGLDAETMGANGTPKQQFARTFLHEKVHVVTIELLSKDREYRENMVKLYNYVSSKADKLKITSDKNKGNGYTYYYGLTDLDEFLAEAHANPEFKQLLDNIIYEEKSIITKIIEFLRDALGRSTKVKPDTSVLRELMMQTEEKISSAIASKSNRPTYSWSDRQILSQLNEEGVYGGDMPESYLSRFANANLMKYDPKTKRFKNKYTNEYLFRENIETGVAYVGGRFRYVDEIDMVKLTESQSSVLEPLNDINGDINKLLEAQDTEEGIRAPNDPEVMKIFNIKDPLYYAVGGAKYFRTTSYLGFGAPTDTILLQNASKQGDFNDELGKRIFRGDDASQTSYEEISKFVRDEAWVKHAAKNKLDINSTELKDKWLETYKEPISLDKFEELYNGLFEAKEELENEGIVKFHADVKVWDSDALVAGEIDILGEYEDGSVAVIDLKTRRKGANNSYYSNTKSKISDKHKHEMQTNSYSNMLVKMGFNVVNPKIVMSQPDQYSSTTPVENNNFKPVETVDKNSTETKYAVIIELNRIPTQVGIFQDVVEEDSSGKRVVKTNKSKTLDRTKYQDFKRNNDYNPEFIDRNIIDQKQRLFKNIKYTAAKVAQYNKLADESAFSDRTSNEFKGFSTKLKNEIIRGVDKIEEDELLTNISEFFEITREQLFNLAEELKGLTDNTADAKATYLEIRRLTELYEVAQTLMEGFEDVEQASSSTSPVEVQQVKDSFSALSKVYQDVNSNIKSTVKRIVLNLFRENYKGSPAEIKLKDELQKKIAKAIPYGKDGLSNREIDGLRASAYNTKRQERKFKEKLEAEVNLELNKLVENNIYEDISSASVYTVDDRTVNNPFVMIATQLFDAAAQDFSHIANREVRELDAFQKQVNLSKKEMEDIIEEDEQGNYYLLSKYSMEFKNILKRINTKISENYEKLNKAVQEGSPVKEFQDNIKILKNERNKWITANVDIGLDGVSTPKAKWLNPKYEALKNSTNPRQQAKYAALTRFEDIIFTNSEERMKNDNRSLRENVEGAIFNRLPGIKETVYGALTTKGVKDFSKRYWEELSQVEIDDTEEGEIREEDGETKAYYVNTSLNGEPVRNVPAYFRGRPKSTQNKDLFTIFGLELQNGIRYEIDNKVVLDALVLRDLISLSSFNRNIGLSKSKILDLGEYNTPSLLDGSSSQTLKYLDKVLNNRAYRLRRVYAGKWGKYDANAVTQGLGNFTTYMSMSFKWLSATSNYFTGKVSTYLEALGGEHYDNKDYRTARNTYFSNVAGIMADVGAPVKMNFVNQLMGYFDAMSEESVYNNAYEKDNKVKQILTDRSSLLMFQSMGEHQIHAVLTMAVLQGQKVLNKRGRYLDMNGKITEKREDAASVLDTFSLDKDGILVQKPWAIYNEHSPYNEISEDNGKPNQGNYKLRSLIKDKVTRTQGAFSAETQAKLSMYWWGKPLMQFKKHIIPTTLNRFRGMRFEDLNVSKESSKMPEDRKYYNIHTMSEEQGYYVTFLQTLPKMLKNWKNVVSRATDPKTGDWRADLSKHQLANIKKTQYELGYIFSVLGLAYLIAAAADDSEDSLLWASAYIARRQFGEAGGQFFSPGEWWRIGESPLTYLRSIKAFSDTAQAMLQPTKKYSSGVNAGENVAFTKFKKLLIGDPLSQFDPGTNKRKFIGITSRQ